MHPLSFASCSLIVGLGADSDTNYICSAVGESDPLRRPFTEHTEDMYLRNNILRKWTVVVAIFIVTLSLLHLRGFEMFPGQGGWPTFVNKSTLGLYSLRRRRLISIGIPIINLRRSSDRLRFIMIPIPIRRRLLSDWRHCNVNLYNTDVCFIVSVSWRVHIVY